MKLRLCLAYLPCHDMAHRSCRPAVAGRGPVCQYGEHVMRACVRCLVLLHLTMRYSLIGLTFKCSRVAGLLGKIYGHPPMLPRIPFISTSFHVPGSDPFGENEYSSSLCRSGHAWKIRPRRPVRRDELMMLSRRASDSTPPTGPSAARRPVARWWRARMRHHHTLLRMIESASVSLVCLSFPTQFHPDTPTHSWRITIVPVLSSGTAIRV